MDAAVGDRIAKDHKSLSAKMDHLHSVVRVNVGTIDDAVTRKLDEIEERYAKAVDLTCAHAGSIFRRV
jgi:hypothetical protein